jgi:hypothetical protein
MKVGKVSVSGFKIGGLNQYLDFHGVACVRLSKPIPYDSFVTLTVSIIGRDGTQFPIDCFGSLETGITTASESDPERDELKRRIVLACEMIDQYVFRDTDRASTWQMVLKLRAVLDEGARPDLERDEDEDDLTRHGTLREGIARSGFTGGKP